MDDAERTEWIRGSIRPGKDDDDGDGDDDGDSGDGADDDDDDDDDDYDDDDDDDDDDYDDDDDDKDMIAARECMLALHGRDTRAQDGGGSIEVDELAGQSGCCCNCLLSADSFPFSAFWEKYNDT